MQILEECITNLPCLPKQLCVEGTVPVFFDIETTGLSPRDSLVYLIGSMTPETIDRDDCLTNYVFRQFFADLPDEEPALLQHFLDSLPEHTVLCHYNGATFDIPFLRKRIEYLDIPAYASKIPSGSGIDFYRILAPINKFYPLSGRRQKQLEPFAGYTRIDPYDGGTLIDFYREYVGRARFCPEKKTELSSALLLHNREDVLGLVCLNSLYPLIALLAGDYVLANCEANKDTALLHIYLNLSDAIAVPVSLKRTLFDGYVLSLHAQDYKAVITLPLTEMTAYYYFPNYRDYYYLPLEDKVIPKSLAASIPKEYRINATKETARQAFTGVLLPQLHEHFRPVFRKTSKDRMNWFELPAMFSSEVLPAYVAELLSLLTAK